MILGDRAAISSEIAPLVADAGVTAAGASDRGDYAYTALDATTRGIMEFHLSPTAPKSATLRMWQLHGGPSATLYAYQGNGAVGIDDFDTAATLICAMTTPTGYNYGYGVPFDTNVLAALQVAYVQGWEYLALRVQSDQLLVYASDGPKDYCGGSPPTLTYEPADPPVARPAGPYTINSGDVLTLDASASAPGTYDLASYAWDLDDDGLFETNVYDWDVFVVSPQYLDSLGVGIGGPYDIHLRVTDTLGVEVVADSTLTIIPEPTTLMLLAIGGLALVRRRTRA